MALNFSSIEALVKKNYLPGIADNIFTSSPVLARLRERADTQNGGSKIVKSLRYAEGNSGSYTGFAQFTINTNYKQHTAAEYDWRQYYANITIDGEEEAKISGDNAIMKLVETKVEAAKNDLKHDLSSGIYNDGTDTTGIDGLPVIMTADNTYGGIARGTYAWWVPSLTHTTKVSTANIIDSTKATYFPKLLRAGISACKINNERPTLIVMTDDLFDILCDIMDEKQRFMDPKLADLGFESLKIQGVTVVPDSMAPDYSCYFINEDYLQLVEHETRNISLSEFVKPADRDGKVAQIFWMGNLVTSSSRHQGSYSDIGDDEE